VALSPDPDKRARQLANLRNAPPAPAGHTRSLRHGGRAEVLFRDVSAEVAELMDALGAAAPVREPDGSLPAADLIAIEVAARALKRWRAVSNAADLYGRLDERTGEPKPVTAYELQAERAVTAAFDVLAMNPIAREKLLGRRPASEALDHSEQRATLDRRADETKRKR
jgi:hypothetical protein